MFVIIARIKMPITVPQTRPNPPRRLVPPITTAAIASSSAPSPRPDVETEFMRELSRSPANPASNPMIAYTRKRTQSTLMPA